ncbi:helix-turn-helix domain-containing protein [Pseudochrobactrum sp. HB0163]|uniref:helix-turn-helix domain-containing protein n=1 Tax=Pseudochrobactrum sp. HB0163 TaxID=3450708 RepID=UPI003F6E2BBB
MVRDFSDFMSGHSATLAVLHDLSLSCRPFLRAADCYTQKREHAQTLPVYLSNTGADKRIITKGERQKQASNICEALFVLLSSYFKVPLQELRSVQRGKKNIARIRQLGMYLAHTMFGLSMAEVACAFNRERTTVKHACHVIEDMREDEAFDRNVSAFEYLIRIIYSDGGVAHER